MTVADVEPTDLFTRRALPVTGNTWNAAERTFEVVFSTGAPVARFDMRGAYTETLSVDGHGGAEGAPVLDHHRRDSLESVLGTVVRAWTVGGEARALVRLSRHNPLAERLAAELADGVRFGISVGYSVEEWRERTDTKTGQRTKEAVRWTVREISVVSVPADRHAITRGDAMTATPTPAPDAPGTPPAAAPDPNPTAAADRTAVTEPTRAAVHAEIRSIATVAGLDRAWADGLIDRGADTGEARRAAFEAMQRRQPPQIRTAAPTAQVGADYTDPAFRARTIGEAVYARVTPRHQVSEPARAYVGMTTLDLARDCLRNASISIAGLAPATVVERALHSTSDFPLILGDGLGRTLREAYQAAPSGLRLVGRQTAARDFKEKHRLQLSETPRLEKVDEHGEFKSGTLAESKESYRLLTYGRVIGFTRQAIVNDDLGAFADMSRRLGRAAAATEAQLLVELVEQSSGAGPLMNDAKRLFHDDHGNVGASSVPSVLSLSNARLKMRRQVGLAGELISVTPTYLVVPPDLETDSEQVLAGLTPTKVEDVNPFKALKLVVEPRLASASRWYVVADPAEVDGLEYAYLEGAEGPQIDTEAGFKVDGVQVRVRVDFGAGFVDWRSWFRVA